MSVQAKLDKIIEHISKAQNAKSGEKEETQDEKDEKKISDISKEIDEITKIIQTKHSRMSIKSHIQQLQDRIQLFERESRPRMRVFHKLDNGSTLLDIYKQTADYLHLDEAMQHHDILWKYPEDLRYILHEKVKQRYALREKLIKKKHPL